MKMRCKHTKKTILFLGLLIFPWSVQAVMWEKNIINVILSTEELLLSGHETVRIAGIDPPQISINRKRDECYSRSVYRYLKLQEGQEVKIMREERDQSLVHVKMKDGKKLSAVMLKNGMAKYKPESFGIKYSKEYKEAEQEAKIHDRGLWHECGVSKYVRMRRKMGTAWRVFSEKYVQFIAPISVGRVKQVYSGNRFQLENGLIIRLLGIEVPETSDERSGFACFGQQSKAYLESLILGERVFLRRDITEIDEDRELPRYVYLPKRKYRREIFVNKKMIQDGYAQSFWGEQDIYFEKNFNQIQNEVYIDTKGAWANCIEEILNNKFKQERRKEVENLQFDEDCRIKGNISGSKKNPVKTFHTPLSGWYGRIDPEMCFETEIEAEAEGFRKVK